jgi:hypothetical protein
LFFIFGGTLTDPAKRGKAAPLHGWTRRKNGADFF